MKLFSNNFDLSPDFNLSAIASVEELASHDMIYIYHHLYPGANLELSQKEVKLNGDIRYSVHFKQFKLGYITIGGFMKELYEGVENFNAQIESLSKQKYLPLKGLDIKLKAAILKKVS